MSKLILWCRDHPIVVIVVIGLFSVFFAYEAKDIRIDASAEGMMIEGDPDKAFYEKTIHTFGTDNITIVYIKDDNLFTTKKLEAIQEVFYKLEELSNIDRVESLFTSKNFNGESGDLETLPVLDWIPETPEESAKARADAMRSPLLYRSLISEDGKAMAINVFVNPDKSDPEFNAKMSDAIDEVIEPLKGVVDEVFQVGMPFTRKCLGDSILGDMTTLIPLSVGVLLIVLVIGLKTLHGAVMPSLTGGLSVLWTVGFMVMMDIPINVLTVIVPSLVLIIGSTEDMHIISEYFEGLELGKDKFGAIDYLASKVGLAIFLTSMTTFIGFLSIVINKITLLKQFGFTASFALLANFIITFSVIPVYLRFFGGGKKRAKHHEEKTEKKTIFHFAAGLILRVIHANKMAVLAAMVVVALIIGVGAVKIKVDNDMLGYFKETSPIRVRSQLLHDDISGTQIFFIIMDAHSEDAFKKPENLKKIFAVQRYMEKTGVFDFSLSFADYIALINRESEGGKKEEFVIPASADLVEQYRFVYLEDKDIERYVNVEAEPGDGAPAFSKANILVRHNLSSSYDLKKALSGLNGFMADTFGTDIGFKFTGENILINKAADSMASGQAISLSLLLAVIFIIMSVLFLRFKAGLLSLAPNLFPIVIIFGIMGYLDIPLNTGTAMIAAIAIGIAVDDTIHFMVRYNNEMKLLNDQEKAMTECIKNEIRPVLSTSFALALGFGVLLVSNFNPVIFFGGLSAIVMLLALSADMFMTPILLSTTKLITLWDMLAVDLKARVITKCPLFQKMRPWQIKKIVLLAHVKEFAKDMFIIRKGETDRAMYLILDGSARVELPTEAGKRVVLSELHPGDIFGEIALVEEVERTADVVASEDSRVLEIDWTSLERIRRIFPMISSKLFLNISRVLGARLAATSEQLVAKG